MPKASSLSAPADEVRFSITYDGPGAQGRMDIRDLAPAMLAMAHLVEHSAAMLAGSTARVKIDVVADFHHGSFSYDVIAQSYDVGKALLDNLSVSDILAFIGVVHTGGRGLFGLVQYMRGRKPKEVIKEGENAKIVFHDGDNITVHVNTLNLYENTTVRRDLEGVVAPLRRETITRLRAGPTTNDSTVEIRQEDVEHFEAPAPVEQELHNKITEELVEVISPMFKQGYKWQIALAGDAPFHCKILDDSFLDRVRRHEIVFGQGDLLRVELRSRVTRDASGSLQRDREIVRVLEHMVAPPPGQQELFPDSPYSE